MVVVRTHQEMFPLVEQWLGSGITQTEFSRRHGLPAHILPYWVKRYRQRHLSGAAAGSTGAAFIEVSAPKTATNLVEICLPSGAVVRFSSLVTAAYLKELLG